MGTLFSLSKSATSIALNISEFALLLFGLLLVVGLIIEYKTEHGGRWMKIGEMLVIIGVAGELLGDGGIFLFSSHLQTIADLEIASLNKEAEDAKKATEDEHSERVKLEAKVAWRRLSKKQQSLIADHLLNRFLGLRVGVSYLGGFPESSQFADDILATLHAGHWNAYRLQPFSLFGGYGGGVYPLHPTTGVNVSITREKGRDVSEAIRNELCSIGFDAAIAPRPPVDRRDPGIDVEVLVVGRPITEQGAKELTIDDKIKACVSAE